MPYHHLGRECFLVPVQFDEDGWFTAGKDGTADKTYEISGDFVQEERAVYTLENTKYDFCFLRHPHSENYDISDSSIILRGTDITLDETDSPTFIGLRQRDFNMELTVNVRTDSGEAGVSVYSCETEHYDIALRKRDNGFDAVFRMNIGGINHEQCVAELKTGKAELIIRSDSQNYRFFVNDGSGEVPLGCGQSKYLSSEVCGGFTGVVLGMYAVGNNTAEFDNFRLEYTS
jgi:alpha-N-arabinofuranosidase